MCGSCFLIHSAILCLLIGAFNPFTFKVIIDRYLFIAGFLYLCSSLSLSLAVVTHVDRVQTVTPMAGGGGFVHFLSTFPCVILSAHQGIDCHPHFTDGETETQRLLPEYTLLFIGRHREKA